MAGTLAECMDGLASLAPGTAYAYPVGSPDTPCYVVGYPEEVDLDMTQGNPRYSFPVWYIVGHGDGPAARDALSAAVGGVSAFKAAVDGAHSWGDAWVSTAEISPMTVAGISYIALKLMVEIV